MRGDHQPYSARRQPVRLLTLCGLRRRFDALEHLSRCASWRLELWGTQMRPWHAIIPGQSLGPRPCQCLCQSWCLDSVAAKPCQYTVAGRFAYASHAVLFYDAEDLSETRVPNGGISDIDRPFRPVSQTAGSGASLESSPWFATHDCVRVYVTRVAFWGQVVEAFDLMITLSSATRRGRLEILGKYLAKLSLNVVPLPPIVADPLRPLIHIRFASIIPDANVCGWRTSQTCTAMVWKLTAIESWLRGCDIAAIETSAFCCPKCIPVASYTILWVVVCSAGLEKKHGGWSRRGGKSGCQTRSGRTTYIP